MIPLGKSMPNPGLTWSPHLVTAAVAPVSLPPSGQPSTGDLVYTDVPAAVSNTRDSPTLLSGDYHTLVSCVEALRPFVS